MSRVTCTACKKPMTPGLDAAKNSKRCRKCVRESRAAALKVPARWWEFEICELVKGDDYWHLRHRIAMKSVCGKGARQPRYVESGEQAVLRMRHDPGLCPKCRVKLEASLEAYGVGT